MFVQIDEVTIRNYKSIREVKLKLKPGLTVLVGPNGAGKTNILLALAQLGYVLSFPLTKKYIINFKNLVKDPSKPLEYEIKGIIDRTPFTYYISLSADEYGLLHVIKEDLSLGDLYIVNEEGKVNINNKIEDTIPPNLPLMSALAAKSENETILSLPIKVIPLSSEVIKNKDVESALHELVNALFKNVAYFNIDPSMASSPHPFDPLPILPPNGSGLPSYLYLLSREDKDKLNELLKPLNLKVNTNIIGDFIYITAEEGGKELTGNNIPAGVVKLIALYALTLDVPTILPSKRQIILIDEIENSLHLDYIQRFIDYVKTSLKDIYVIVTTHSPLVLDNVDLEDILLVTKEGDETKVSSIENVEELKRKLEELKISQSEGILYGLL